MEIRIIPMSLNDEEFTDMNIKDVQEKFFMKNLIDVNKGWYYYGKNGLIAETGDLLLFQMENSIIASAVLEQVMKFKKATIEGNTGALVIDRKTIKVFNPISKDELKQYIPDFVAFNQTKGKYEIKEVNIEELYKRMNNNG